MQMSDENSTYGYFETLPLDIVLVVRCKDCKHFRRNLENDTYCDCVGGLSDPEENDFCSYGEWWIK